MTRKRITDEQLREAYERLGGVHNLVAKELGCSRENVRQRLTRMNLAPMGKNGKRSDRWTK